MQIINQNTNLNRRDFLYILGACIFGIGLNLYNVIRNPRIEEGELVNKFMFQDAYVYALNLRGLKLNIYVAEYLKSPEEFIERAKREGNPVFMCTLPFFDIETEKSVCRIKKGHSMICSGSYADHVIIYDGQTIKIEKETYLVYTQVNEFIVGGLPCVVKNNSINKIKRGIPTQKTFRIGVVPREEMLYIVTGYFTIEEISRIMNNIGACAVLFDAGSSGFVAIRTDTELGIEKYPGRNIKGVLVAYPRHSYRKNKHVIKIDDIY